MDEDAKIGDLRVWHIPQVPGKPFHVLVDTPQEAQRVIQLLAAYDVFQYENKIKPDYMNVSGLEVFEADGVDGKSGWCEWYDDATADDIHDWVDPEASIAQAINI